MAKKRFTTRKYQGDDCYSWAVFKDGRPFLTGLSRASARHYAAKHEKEGK